MATIAAAAMIPAITYSTVCVEWAKSSRKKCGIDATLPLRCRGTATGSPPRRPPGCSAGGKGDQRGGQLAAHLGDQDRAEDRQAHAGRVVADRLGDAGGLAVGAPAGPVDGVGAGRPEHEAHAGAGQDDVPLLRAEAELGDLPRPQEEPDGAEHAADHDRALGPDAVEHPSADLRGDDKADEEVQQDDARLGGVFPSEICAYSLPKKNTGMNTRLVMPSTRFSTRNGRMRKMLTRISGDSVRTSTK